jgi:hypothetical protein
LLVGFGFAVLIGVLASMVITRVSGLRPLLAMLFGLAIVLLLALIAIVVLSLASRRIADHERPSLTRIESRNYQVWDQIRRRADLFDGVFAGSVLNDVGGLEP